ncbi:AbrB/MazE/SpoVT family DNA-binding domain-containing protein [Demequina sp.]|uniref:AbrB/MazE/SpoVT family DNA-binding domain-containing protein n=1 Tax=Demequina sp. TaxID=2050685 RepID=UPI003D0BEFDB
MASLHGPVRLSSNLQFRLPAQVARQLHFAGGDDFYLRVSDDNPNVVEIVPSEVVERRYSAGERAEKSALSPAQEIAT